MDPIERSEFLRAMSPSDIDAWHETRIRDLWRVFRIMGEFVEGFETLEKLESVNLRHHQIQNDQVDRFGSARLQNVESLTGSVCGYRVKAVALDQFFEDTTLGGVVINNQNFMCHAVSLYLIYSRP